MWYDEKQHKNRISEPYKDMQEMTEKIEKCAWALLKNAILLHHLEENEINYNNIHDELTVLISTMEELADYIHWDGSSLADDFLYEYEECC